MASYQAIQSKIEALQKAAQVALKREAASVIKNIQTLMAEYGITPADLRTPTSEKEKPGRKKNQRTKGAPKYRNPKTGQTWTGMGKPPAWMVGPRKSGTADDFLINRQAAAKKAPTKVKAKISSARKKKSTKSGAVAKKTSSKLAAKNPSAKKRAAPVKTTAVAAKTQPKAISKKTAPPKKATTTPTAQPANTAA